MAANLVSAMLTGFLFGVAAGFSPGPLTLLVVTQTLRHNTKEGALAALAPLLTDVPIIAVTYFLLKQLDDAGVVFGIISAAGGVYVIRFALETMRIKPVAIDAGDSHQAHSLLKGALINGLNPNPYLFWSTVGVPFIIKAQVENQLAPWVFVIAFLSLLVGSKIGIAIVIGRFRTFFAGKTYLYMMRGLGLILGVFGVRLVWNAVGYLCR
jgi:threonine/homoserine/homoserine lactone efflux protein